MRIQIDFANPNSITLDASNPDQLEVTFLDNSLFRSLIGMIPIDEDTFL